MTDAARMLPPLFEKRVDVRFDRLNVRCRRLDARIARMDASWRRMDYRMGATLSRIEDGVDRLVSIGAIRHDSDSSIDDNGPFDEVSLFKGGYPWGKQVRVGGELVRLPKLDNMAAINGLTLPEATGYYAGYYSYIQADAGLTLAEIAVGYCPGNWTS